MTTVEQIKDAMERALRTIGDDPSAGRGTAVTTVRIRDGVTCDVQDGPWTLVGDEMPGDGGNGEGPDPGVFARAALGTCLAMGYVQFAALRDIPLSRVEVEVQADYDARGMLGLDDAVPPGWTGLRYTVRVESPAPEADVQRLIDEADAHSSILYCFARPLDVQRSVEIRGGQ